MHPKCLPSLYRSQIRQPCRQGHLIFWQSKKDGTVWSWGLNFFGQLGDGTTDNRTSPSQIPSLKGVAAAAAGNNHSVVLLNDGTVWTFGDNTLGQLGDDSNSLSRSLPLSVPSLRNIVSIASGANFTLALQNNGTVWAWGDNTNGQLGDGTLASRRQPVQVTGLSGVTAVSAGKKIMLLRLKVTVPSGPGDITSSASSATIIQAII